MDPNNRETIRVVVALVLSALAVMVFVGSPVGAAIMGRKQLEDRITRLEEQITRDADERRRHLIILKDIEVTVKTQARDSEWIKKWVQSSGKGF